MSKKSVFSRVGLHVVVDGQFGSTGKGLMASYLAEKAASIGYSFHYAISNGGPNSGHTFYGPDGVKHVLKQLPTFAVASYFYGVRVEAVLSAGAVINPQILKAEAEKYPHIQIWVDPRAAVITDADKIAENHGSIAEVAGTRSGTGSAIARKVLRDKNAVWSNEGHRHFMMPSNVGTQRVEFNQMLDSSPVFMEVSQGFSLGLNSQFYPKVTSRECTVMQGIADARIAPRHVARTYMVVRTFPIRVGNVDGYSSGDHYPDQEELSWHDIGVEPELTTVTQRVRRVFTFSKQQYREALLANQPDIVLVNFMNYINGASGQRELTDSLELIGFETGVDPDFLFGHGPLNSDITPF